MQAEMQHVRYQLYIICLACLSSYVRAFTAARPDHTSRPHAIYIHPSLRLFTTCHTAKYHAAKTTTTSYNQYLRLVPSHVQSISSIRCVLTSSRASRVHDCSIHKCSFFLPSLYSIVVPHNACQTYSLYSNLNTAPLYL